MDEQTKLLTLAHLKNGKSPGEVAEVMGISYGKALKLRKELLVAEEQGLILELFNLSEASLEILLDSVTKQLQPAIEAFNVGELVEESVHTLAEGITGAKVLQQDMQVAATAIAQRITTVASSASNAETMVSLSKALCELQVAFFGPGGGGSAGGPALPAAGSFERLLKN